MSSDPRRIQRKRTAGWRMPEGAVYVGRGSYWGNPFRVYKEPDLHEPWCVDRGPTSSAIWTSSTEHGAHAKAVTLFKKWLYSPAPGQSKLREEIKIALRGKHLACWCPDHLPCHADVLLRIANHE